VRCVGTDVEIVHFSFLEVTVAATRVVEGVEGVPPVVREMSVVRIAEETAHFLVLLLKAGVFLLELTNLDQRGREGGDLVWGEAESGLEFCDGLFELLDVGLSLCAMASLGFCITAALWAIRLL
jgi:hypothetical protein